MSNYFDNQKNWSWQVQDGKAVVVTHHDPHHAKDRPHTHNVDVSKVSVGEMSAGNAAAVGKAHQKAEHIYDQPTEKGEKQTTNVKSSEEGRGRDDNDHGRYSRNDGLKRDNSSNHHSQPKRMTICEKTFPYRVIGWTEAKEPAKASKPSTKAVNGMRAEMKSVSKSGQSAAGKSVGDKSGMGNSAGGKSGIATGSAGTGGIGTGTGGKGGGNGGHGGHSAGGHGK